VFDGAQPPDFSFDASDWFTGFDCRGTGQAAHAPAGRAVGREEGIGIGERFPVHVTNYTFEPKRNRRQE